MENDKVPNVTISFSKEEKKTFDTLCEVETHGPSAQVKHMMKFYLQYKDKVKYDGELGIQNIDNK